MSQTYFTRINTLRNHVDAMLLAMTDTAYRRNGYVHLYGVGMAASLLALKRGLDPELAQMAGILHDYASYAEAAEDDHAIRGAALSREVLERLSIATAEEVDAICTAISRHSDKHRVDGPFDELLKDADVMHHWLRNPKEPPSSWEMPRIEALCEELGLDFSLCR